MTLNYSVGKWEGVDVGGVIYSESIMLENMKSQQFKLLEMAHMNLKFSDQLAWDYSSQSAGEEKVCS